MNATELSFTSWAYANSFSASLFASHALRALSFFSPSFFLRNR